MCHLKHRLRIFLFWGKTVFHSQDIQVFVFSTIQWFTKSVTSQWVLVHETWDKVHFWIHLLNHKSWGHQTWSVDRYNQVQKFSVIFWTIWKTGVRFQVLFNLPTCSNYSITKYAKIPVFHFFEKVNKGQLKMVYVNH